MAYTMRNRAFARFGFLSLGLGLMMWPALALAAPEAVAVNVDQAKLVRLPGKVATIVVGNPLIADVSLQPGGIIVVTGKGYGATNFIALDRAGEVLVDRLIQVEGPNGSRRTSVDGLDQVIHERLFAVETTASGEARVQEPGVLVNFAPASVPEHLPGVVTRPEATQWLTQQALTP